MATPTTSIPANGGGFLTEQRAPGEVFTAEDLSEEHLAIGRTVDAFYAQEVEPHLDAVQHHDPGVARAILQKAADLGLTGIMIPERFGGMEMDLTAMMVAAEHFAGDASFSGWQSAHVGIGTLPLLFFGNEQQKAKYLPRLANLEMLAAYALTEPHAGSDALAARTRADLSPDGKHYVLNGQKMWITNGGAADLFTVFAKVGGEKFTAFLVERAHGVKSGAEEKKMGIKGSSTTALFLDNVKVPVENVLGEIGRGHIIALNVLNIGRLKLGPGTMGGAKKVLAACLKYAKERKAFGSAIAEFGAIRHKLAEMAIRVFADESMIWRTVGMIENRLNALGPDHILKAVEEFAVECSIVKVFASEVLDYVADEGVQIHGGYGFHQDYMVERAYRDSRINRIFEGTNEINRLLIPGMLLKRAARGLVTLAPPTGPAPDDPDAGLVYNAKQIALAALNTAAARYGKELEREQETLMHIADILIETYAMDSVLLRARKVGQALSPANIVGDMASVFLRDAMARIEVAARNVLPIETVRPLAAYEPVDSIALRRKIAARLLQAERYAL
jgi:alkylation response protein AidB-like acyl-CoA dehydrogenase